jgi:hypothetical protein
MESQEDLPGNMPDENPQDMVMLYKLRSKKYNIDKLYMEQTSMNRYYHGRMVGSSLRVEQSNNSFTSSSFDELKEDENFTSNYRKTGYRNRRFTYGY